MSVVFADESDLQSKNIEVRASYHNKEFEFQSKAILAMKLKFYTDLKRTT